MTFYLRTIIFEGTHGMDLQVVNHETIESVKEEIKVLEKTHPILEINYFKLDKLDL